MAEDSKALFGFFAAGAIVKFAVMMRGSRARPQEVVKVGSVSELFLHPVKSCAPLSIKQGFCSNEGLIDTENGFLDRTFMVADEEKNSRQTLREHPKMALIQPTFLGDHQLSLDAPGMDTLIVDIKRPDGQPSIVKISDRRVYGVDCGEAGAAWMSKYLESPMRLLYTDADVQTNNMQAAGTTKWHKAAKSKDRTVFQDFAPFNITLQSSLDELNTRLDKPVDIRQFRPTFVVDEAPAWDEDNWNKIYVGEDTCFTVLKPCDRCVLINVTADTGEKDTEGQPLKKLREYRVMADVIANKPIFGLQITLEYGGNVKVGDPVYVLKGPRWWEKK